MILLWITIVTAQTSCRPKFEQLCVYMHSSPMTGEDITHILILDTTL